MSTASVPRFAGYILCGGPLDGAAVHGRTPTFVRVEYDDDGTADVYRPTGKADASSPSLERYQLEPMISANVYDLTLRPHDAENDADDRHFRVRRLAGHPGEVYGSMDGRALTATLRTNSSGDRVINWDCPGSGMDESTHQVVGWAPAHDEGS